MTAQATQGAVVMLVPDWEARTLALFRQAMAERDQQQEQAAAHPLSVLEAASKYYRGPANDPPAKKKKAWRELRCAYKIIDERASLGPEGRLCRWDPEKLAQVMSELAPKFRRPRRKVGAVDV